MAVAVALPLTAITPDERSLIDYHLDRLSKFRRPNEVKEAYYEGSIRVKQLGIAIPPRYRDAIDLAVGWPGTTVDVLDERLEWYGWTSDDDGDRFGLSEVYVDNGLDVEVSLGVLDALLYGTSFIAVGSGSDGDPHPLVTIESPMTMTGEMDGRSRRLSSALSVDVKVDGNPSEVTLYLPNETIRAQNVGGVWRPTDRDQHGLGRVTVARLVNRPRGSKVEGRSEITRPIRGYTDQAVRTLLGMEINREFYSAPQRYAMGVGEDAFVGADGQVKTGWEAVMGRMLAFPADEDGNLPQVGQFNPASPTPYLEQVRGLAQLVAAEGALPSSYLGFTSDNPASADAIRAAEARLVKRAERRQVIFGRALREVGALALLVRDGTVPDEFRAVSNAWADAATPTRAAAADEAVKLVGAGVLPPDSPVTLNRLGISLAEQRQLATDRRRANASARLTALASAAEQARQDPDVAGAQAGARGDG